MLLPLLSFCFLAGVLAQQTVLGPNFTPNETGSTLHLSSIASEQQYAILYHRNYPNHQIRIKKTNFCDPTVNVYTGYLDVDSGAKHLFFYFFESRRNPDQDDVMMWINGGPGCSSSMGLLMELGPCLIDMGGTSSNGTSWNPYSWNKEANIFFLDQPVGVGFSYADFGETVGTTEEAARNVQAFITIFFETFSQFTGRPLHLSGESYAGRYLPVFASEIYDQNKFAAAEGRPAINLKSVLIGNGITDISTLYEGRYLTECGTAALDVPFQSIKTCVRMKQALPRCQEAIRNNCVTQLDPINCPAAFNFCDLELSTGFWDSGRNPYDISKMCESGTDLCYKETDVIEDYLNTPGIRALLGAESPTNFTACSPTVGGDFYKHMDKYSSPTQYYITGLLERGIRILIYLGTYDWQCNASANKLWVEKLEWSGQKEYVAQEWQEWFVHFKKAGETKRHVAVLLADIGLTFHVPHDKPAEAQALVSRWLAGTEL